MFPKGDTAISGVWIDRSPSSQQGPRREPIAYVVQDSNVNPAAVAVFGLGETNGPQLYDSLKIEDPNSLIADAQSRALNRALGGAGLAAGKRGAKKEPAARQGKPQPPPRGIGLSLDMEGIAACSEDVGPEADASGIIAYGRAFWIVCEGKGALLDGASEDGKGRFVRPNLLVKLTPDAERQGLAVARVVELPEGVRDHQEPKGFEGVAVGPKGYVYVAFQRGWTRAGDPAGFTRMGRFDPKEGTWAFAHYPLDPYAVHTAAENGSGPERVAGELPEEPPEEPPKEIDGAWVGVSELTRATDGRLLVLERDNQRGDLAIVQRIYAIDVEAIPFQTAAPLPVIGKELVFDLLENGVRDPRYGAPIRKPEALGVLGPQELLLIADDDGKRGSKKGTPFFFLRTQ